MTRIKLAMLAVFSMAAGNAQSATSVWENYPAFHGPGHAGILIGDFDGDGRSEAAVSGYSKPGYSVNGMQLLAVLGADSSGALSVETISMLPTQTFSGKFRLAPREGAADRIVAVLSSENAAQNQIALLGGVPLRVLRTIPAPNIHAVSGVADVDADGDLEVVALSGSSSWGDKYPVILDYATGAVEWVGATVATSVGIAQLDADSAMELVLAGTPGRIIDGATRQVEWSWPSGFGENILVGQFAADPATKTFAISRQWSGFIQIFRANPYSPISEISVGEVGALNVVRMNGVDQIAVGGGQWGNITVYNPRSGAILFSATNPEHGVSAIAGGDLDGDAGIELVYGAGLSSSGADLLRVIDSATQQDEYFRLDEVGPHSALARGDAAGNSSDQVAYVTLASRSNYAGSNLRVVDAASGRTLRSRENVMDSWSGGVPNLAMAQLDDDPQAEIVLASTALYTPSVAVFDGTTLVDQWRRSDFTNDSASISSLDLIDINADGVSDVVVALTTGRIHVLDGRNGASLWQSVTISGSTAPSIASFSSNGGASRIVMGTGNALYVLEPSAGLVTSVVKTPEKIIVVQIWGTGDACEVGALDERDTLAVYSCADLGYKRQLQMPVGTRFFRPFNVQATRFIAAAGNVLYEVRAGRPPAVLSGVLGDAAGAGNHGSVTLNPDGKSADVVIGSMHMVTRLRVETEDLFAHGFE